jgi:hypothetical protein
VLEQRPVDHLRFGAQRFGQPHHLDLFAVFGETLDHRPALQFLELVPLDAVHLRQRPFEEVQWPIHERAEFVVSHVALPSGRS